MLVGLGVGGYYAWKKFGGGSAAYKAYTQFADAMAYNRWDEARTMCTGSGCSAIDHETRSLRFGIGPAVTASRMQREIAGEVEWTRYRKESEVVSEDGSVSITALQTSCRLPPGTSGMCRNAVDHSQTATVVKEGGAWKVSSFSSQRR